MLVAGGAGGVGEAIVRTSLDGARALRDRIGAEHERIAGAIVRMRPTQYVYGIEIAR